MSNLPADRTKLNTAISNQQPSKIAASQANREALIEAYDTIDQLYNFVTGFVAGGTLQPYPSGITRQAIINGGFAVNQRVKTGTVVLTAGQYGHDRWKAGASGCTYTFATVDNVTTITITAGSLVQVIEGIHLYSGTYTLTWTGTAQGKIGAGSYGATGITGTVAGGTNLSIEFGIGTLSQVQFNFGSSAVPFQPRSFAEELAMCQRYYEKSYNVDVPPGTSTIVGNVIGQASTAIAASTSGTLVTPCGDVFKVVKRSNPTVTVYGIDGTINAISLGGGSTTRTGISAQFTSQKQPINYLAVSSVSATPITDRTQVQYQWTADAEL